MNYKIYRFVLFIAFLSLITIGCVKNTPKEIVVFLPSADNPFWIEVRRGVEDAATELGKDYKVTILSSGDLDAAAQVEQLSSVLSRGKVDAIAIAIANNRAPAPMIAKYNKAGIPVVMMDTKLEEDAAVTAGASYDVFIGSDNRLGGQKAADEMTNQLKKLGYGNKVLLIKGDYIHQSAIDRAEGFIEKGKSQLQIIEREGEWSRQRATEITIAVLARETVDGIFTGNDDMALGVIAALKSSGLPKEKLPVVIGFDATSAGMEAIKEGYMYASMKQDPVRMGKAGVVFAKELIIGTPSVEKENMIPVSVAK